MLVKHPWVPDEPFAIGRDPEAIWKLLQRVKGWYCVNVPTDLGPSVATVLQRELGLSTRLRRDVYFILEQDAISYQHPAVRLLTSKDVPLIDRAPPELRGGGYSSTAQMVTEGIAAGGFSMGSWFRLWSCPHILNGTPTSVDIHLSPGMAGASAVLNYVWYLERRRLVAEARVEHGGRQPSVATGSEKNWLS